MKRLMFIPCILTLLLSACTAETADNTPRDSVSAASLESAIKAQIKAELIVSGTQESDFEDEMLPEYRSVFLAQAKGLVPAEYDLSCLEDGVGVMHTSPERADLVAVARVRDGKLTDAEALARALRDYQLDMAERYLPDQMNKVEENIIKVIGNYIIYITCDRPEEMEDGIMRVIR